MSDSLPSILLFAHSFVKRLKSDLAHNFDDRAVKYFNLDSDAVIHMFGVGGRTISKAMKYDLHVFSELKPAVVILELGTNDLSSCNPEVVGSLVDDFVNFLMSSFSVRVVGV